MPVSVWDEEGEFVVVDPVYPGVLDSLYLLVSTLNVFSIEVIGLSELYTVALGPFARYEFVLYLRDDALVVSLSDKTLVSAISDQQRTVVLDTRLNVYVSDTDTYSIGKVILE